MFSCKENILKVDYYDDDWNLYKERWWLIDYFIAQFHIFYCRKTTKHSWDFKKHYKPKSLEQTDIKVTYRCRKSQSFTTWRAAYATFLCFKIYKNLNALWLWFFYSLAYS